jgi:hypothetical protein
MQIIIETQTFPPVSFFARAIRADKVLLETHEHYQKRSLRNKCIILNSNGPQVLTIPLMKGKNEQMNIREVRISYDQNWPEQFRKHLQSAYGKSPFYMHYEAELFQLLDSGTSYLLEMNTLILNFVGKKSGCMLTLGQTEEYLEKYSGNYCDLRNCYTLKGGPKARNDAFYPQVFEHKFGFVSGLSILDLLFNMGNESVNILKQYDFQEIGLCK